MAGRRPCTTPAQNPSGGDHPGPGGAAGPLGVECAGGAGRRPIGTLDLYATSPRAWDDTEITALQAYAGVVASLLGAAAKAELKGALADQLQVALDSRVLIERAKGALMERERLDEQEAFTHRRSDA
jgi:hypothetical protein